MELQERYRGALLGLAVGDALGTTLEFKPPGSFEPMSDMVGGGPFKLAAGQWTDDTSMALCLAESLIEMQGFDPADQMQRYVRWWKEGHLSATGECFDIGMTVSAALGEFRRSGKPYCGSKDPGSAGNGSLMRLAPLPMAYRSHKDLWHYAADSSATTHGARACLDACGFYSVLIARALNGYPKELLLARNPMPSQLSLPDTSKPIRRIAEGSYKTRQPPDIKGTGYVVDALEAALWAFHASDSFRDGALLAVNLGDDADTTGAIYGQLAGAHYGMSGIPADWAVKVSERAFILASADALYALSFLLSA